MPYTWTDPTGATVSIYSVDGSAGIMTLDNVDNEGTQVLATLDVEECEVTFAMDWVTGGAGEITPGVYYRAASDLSTFFKVEFQISLDVLTQDEMTSITVFSEQGIVGTAIVSKVHTAGVPLRVKVRSTTNHFVKVWNSNVAEPSSWDLVTGTGSLAHGTVGLTATAALDDATPAALSDVLWIWGGETAVTGYASPAIATQQQVIAPTTVNMSITAAGTGFDGVGRAVAITVAAQNGRFEAGDGAIRSGSVTVATYFHIRFVGSLPTDDAAVGSVFLFGYVYSGIPGLAGVAFRPSDSRLVLQPNSTTSSGLIAGPVVVANTWYEIQFTSDSLNSPYVFNWSVDGVAQTGGTRVATANRTVTNIRFGPSVANVTGVIWYDDMIVQNSIAHYPITSTVELKRLMPAATITQAGTVNVWCRFTNNGAGLDVTFNASDILAAITEYPPSQQIGTGSDGFYQRISGTVSDQIHLPFANLALSPGQGVGAVRVYAASWTSTLNVAGGLLNISANVGGSATTLFAGFSAQTATQWEAEVYTPSGNWDSTKLDALIVSFNAGNDISPLPGARFVMSEVAVLTSSGGSSTVIDVEFDDFQVCSCEVE